MEVRYLSDLHKQAILVPVGYRNADDDHVWNRDYSYFRASGGVDCVWRHHASGRMNTDDAHPADGVSVRLRRG